MSKILTFALLAAFITDSSSFCAGVSPSIFENEFEYEENFFDFISSDFENKTEELPVITINPIDSKWTFIPDVSQSKTGDWSTCIGIAHDVTREMAINYAESNPDVTYFFYVKNSMILENDIASPPFVRIFNQDDAVFFGGSPESAEFGSAPDMADSYLK